MISECSGVTGGGGGQGGHSQRLLTGKFLMTYWEKRGKEKMEKGWKLIRKGGKLEMKAGKHSKKRWGPFFFFFFFFFFFASHFWKRRKFVLGLPNWEFSTGKKHFTPGKKSGKMTLPPQKNMPVTPLSEWVFVIRNKFGIPMFSNHEKARQEGSTENAHPGSHNELKSI